VVKHHEVAPSSREDSSGTGCKKIPSDYFGMGGEDDTRTTAGGDYVRRKMYARRAINCVIVRKGTRMAEERGDRAYHATALRNLIQGSRGGGANRAVRPWSQERYSDRPCVFAESGPIEMER
jgi:hypothetical protein